MELFLIRGWEPIIPGVRCPMYDPQPAIDQWGCGFLTVRGGFHRGDHRVRSQVVGVVLGVSRYF